MGVSIAWRKWLMPLALGALCLAWPLSLLARHQLGLPAFWFDESGQFWMALGLHHTSPPLSPVGSLWDVLDQNRKANLDPGLFTLLLRFWVGAFGASPTALRALPFSFFALSVVLLTAAVKPFCRRTPWLAPVCAAVVFFYPLLLEFSTELRAYSMEACGVIYGFLALRRMDRDGVGVAEAAAWALGTVFFIGSRYSYVVFAVVQCAILCALLLKHRGRLKPTAVFAALCAAGALAAYFLSLRYQSPALKPPSYTDGGLLVNSTWEALRGKLIINFLSSVALPTTVFLLIGPALKQARLLWAYGALCTAGFALLAYRGMMPWQMDTRWSLSLQSLSSLCLAALAALAGEALWEAARKGGKRSALVAAMISAVAVGSMVRMNFKGTREYDRSHNDSLYDLLPKVDFAALNGRKVYVGKDASATLRYLYEYGPLRGSAPYPGSFLIEDPTAPLSTEELLQRSSHLLLGRMDQPDLQGYKARFAHRLKEVGGLHPSHLFEVIKY